jgi:hypothetical protein
MRSLLIVSADCASGDEGVLDTKWKDLVLKSGLPLEYEVKAYLDEKGLVPSHEFAYLREDETGRKRSFSYDVRATMLLPGHQLELMIECKYRHPAVSWFFLPEEYGGIYELNPLDVYHPIYHFSQRISPLAHSSYYYPPLAPAVGRGVEITDSETNPKSIHQATTQLAYSFTEQIVEAVVSEVDRLLVKDIVLCHVPIIVTTANLFRLKEGVTIRDVRNAATPADIADPHDMLVMKQPEDPEIYGRNLEALDQLNTERGDDLKKKMNWHNDNLDHLLGVLSKQPRAYIVLRFTEDRASFNRFLKYTADCFDPESDFYTEVQKRRAELDVRMAEFTTRNNRRPSD